MRKVQKCKICGSEVRCKLKGHSEFCEHHQRINRQIREERDNRLREVRYSNRKNRKSMIHYKGETFIKMFDTEFNLKPIEVN